MGHVFYAWDLYFLCLGNWNGALEKQHNVERKRCCKKLIKYLRFLWKGIEIYLKIYCNRENIIYKIKFKGYKANMPLNAKYAFKFKICQ